MHYPGSSPQCVVASHEWVVEPAPLAFPIVNMPPHLYVVQSRSAWAERVRSFEYTVSSFFFVDAMADGWHGPTAWIRPPYVLYFCNCCKILVSGIWARYLVGASCVQNISPLRKQASLSHFAFVRLVFFSCGLFQPLKAMLPYV